jgi:hypothetical protein
MTDQTKSLLLQHGHPVAREFLQLVKNMDKEHPSPADLQALRDMLGEHPDLWRVAGDMAYAVALDVIDKIEAGPLIAESLKRGWIVMKQEFNYHAAPPLERLLIEQIILSWLHLNVVELGYTGVMRESLPCADQWERRLSAAQRRFLRACETLARIRKLARTTPALQVNIAADGGQQINLLDAGPTTD